MNTRNPEAECIEASALVLDLLRLDPGALASMKRDGEQKNDAVLLGLQEFLRRVFQFALELRETDASAIALTPGPRWPKNERVGRLGVLLSWSLAREFRWYQVSFGLQN